jgi:hypothetical protein
MIVAGMFVSCEVDNYEGPDGTLTGSVIDAVTGNPILTEQPNGYRIRYREISWSETATNQYLWGKPDGTFNHTKLFAGTYEVEAVEGAFVGTEPQQIEIKSGGVTTINFTVTPYISFSNFSAVKEGVTSVRVTFTITRNVASAALQDYRVFASSKTPYVGTNTGGFESDVSLASTPLTEADLGKPVTITLSNYMAGKTYYIRAGARCANPSNRYNMTEVVTVNM